MFATFHQLRMSTRAPFFPRGGDDDFTPGALRGKITVPEYRALHEHYDAGGSRPKLALGASQRPWRNVTGWGTQTPRSGIHDLNDSARRENMFVEIRAIRRKHSMGGVFVVEGAGCCQASAGANGPGRADGRSR